MLGGISENGNRSETKCLKRGQAQEEDDLKKVKRMWGEKGTAFIKWKVLLSLI